MSVPNPDKNGPRVRNVGSRIRTRQFVPPTPQILNPDKMFSMGMAFLIVSCTQPAWSHTPHSIIVMVIMVHINSTMFCLSPMMLWIVQSQSVGPPELAAMVSQEQCGGMAHTWKQQCTVCRVAWAEDCTHMNGNCVDSTEKVKSMSWTYALRKTMVSTIGTSCKFSKIFNDF